MKAQLAAKQNTHGTMHGDFMILGVLILGDNVHKLTCHVEVKGARDLERKNQD